MALEVPAVDISAWVRDGSREERASVAAAVDAACRTVGFMQVLGHNPAAALYTSNFYYKRLLEAGEKL